MARLPRWVPGGLPMVAQPGLERIQAGMPGGRSSEGISGSSPVLKLAPYSTKGTGVSGFWMRGCR